MVNYKPDVVEVHVDGSSKPNKPTGNAGAGLVVIYQGKAYGFSVPLGQGTNNYAELLAIKHGLEKVSEGFKKIPNWKKNTLITFYSDSLYAMNSVNGEWALTKNKKNYELIREVKDVVNDYPNVQFVHERGHQGNKWNEWADELASEGVQGGNNRYVREIDED